MQLAKRTQEVLSRFSRNVIRQSKSNLTRLGKKSSGDLYSSLKHKLKVSPRSFELDFYMAEYGKFQDKGVKGFRSSKKAPKSPYRFGTGTGEKGGLTKNILNWVTKKRFQFRDKKTGRFLSYKQTANRITRSIYLTGIPTTNFFSKPFEDNFKKLPNEIVQAYMLDMDSFFDFTTE